MRRLWKPIRGIVVAAVGTLGVIGYLWLTNIADPMPLALLGSVDGS